MTKSDMQSLSADKSLPQIVFIPNKGHNWQWNGIIKNIRSQTIA